MLDVPENDLMDISDFEYWIFTGNRFLDMENLTLVEQINIIFSCTHYIRLNALLLSLKKYLKYH